MDNQQSNDQPIQEAEIVTEDTQQTPPTENTTAVEVLLNLESMIKSHITGIDSRKTELKKYKEMLSSALTNDETYRAHDQAAKEAAKLKGQTKLQILKLAANAQLAHKVQDLASEVKEMDAALSDYLREYQRLSGATEIETDEGDIREIVYIAKLIKKAMKQK